MCDGITTPPEVPEEPAGALPGGEGAAEGEASQEDRQQEDPVPQVGEVKPILGTTGAKLK